MASVLANGLVASTSAPTMKKSPQKVSFLEIGDLLSSGKDQIDGGVCEVGNVEEREILIKQW